MVYPGLKLTAESCDSTIARMAVSKVPKIRLGQSGGGRTIWSDPVSRCPLSEYWKRKLSRSEIQLEASVELGLRQHGLDHYLEGSVPAIYEQFSQSPSPDELRLELARFVCLAQKLQGARTPRGREAWSGQTRISTCTARTP